VKIDPRQRGKIVINLGTENGTDGDGGRSDFDTENDRFSYSKLQNYGRGKLLYCYLNNYYLLLLLLLLSVLLCIRVYIRSELELELELES
jgi:hypothetical protein